MSEAVEQRLPNERVSDRFWHAPLEFVVHAFVGTCIFAILTIPALALDYVMRYLRATNYGVSSLLILGIEIAEYGLFGMDLVLFGVFLWRTAARTVKKL
jgi:hypothetical protein